MPLCDYGCGNNGIYQFKSGRWCCCKSANQCSAKRKRDSEKKKGIPIIFKNGHPRGATGLIPWNKCKKIDDILTKEQADEIKKKISQGVINSIPTKRHLTESEEKLRRKKNI